MTFDESRRSAQPHDQRQGSGAPAWWSQLERGDLPEDADRVSSPTTTTGDAASQPRQRARNWLINAAAMLVALGVVMLCLGALSLRGALITALIFGVPMVLVVITVTIAARRAR